MSGDAGAAAVAERRVLSVQSHVVHGYVGNARAPGPASGGGGGDPADSTTPLPRSDPRQTTYVRPKFECFDT